LPAVKSETPSFPQLSTVIHIKCRPILFLQAPKHFKLPVRKGLEKKIAVDKIINSNPALKVGKCVILWE
jgi:hypothetical protein